MVELPLCPITQETLEDPVVAPDGFTYERLAIEAWLEQNGTSPQTREAMRVEDLVPNRALRGLIEDQGQGKSEGLKENIAEEINHDVTSPEELYERASIEVKSSARVSTAAPDEILVHVDVPDSTKCTTPNHICCVIDVSGSMQVEAPCKDETGEEARTGLSVLDVVKFAALVTSQSLGPNDQLSIVTFSDKAKLCLSPTCMDDNGKMLAKNALKRISVEGMTNLWAGISEGVKLAGEVGSDFNNSVFVLTDGLPNVDPPLGYERAMDRLLTKHPFYGTISTFGFGYSLDSCLLNKLSRLGGGYFSFIPDAGFVGTCFINAVANVRSAFGLNPRVVIHKAVEDAEVSGDGQLCAEKMGGSDCSTSIRLTPFRYGQSAVIVLNGKLFSLDNKMEIQFRTMFGRTVTIPVKPVAQDFSLQAEDVFHSVRAKFVKEIHEVVAERGTSRGRAQSNRLAFSFQAAQGKRESSGTNISESVNALTKDIEGQATEALMDEYFSRWGRHYLLSLSCAHLHQFCNNFKDPGVQIYGTGVLFRSLQEDLNDIFEALPPPKPSVRRSQPGPALASMTRTFNNRNVVCVHGETSVLVPKDGANEGSPPSRLPISMIQRGDKVLTSCGTFAGVRCVVKTEVDKSTPLAMIRVGKLLVTPYHPIFVEGDWKFPIDTKRGELVELDDCDGVYNLVLDDEHRSSAVLMNSVPCITLGHGVKDGNVLPHSFFGTDSIIDNLKLSFPRGWEDGQITLRESDVLRDKHNGMICGLFVPGANESYTAVDLIGK
uniref:U-box domain-containing protein n=1 Tax=Odontella aurita TaxID=265563 RepID=A0A7S4JAI2_9STRA|mmetsp:Transcript_42542/g.129106  ORF Transcript_42542/g.129106 Transcript_42542/m.129106 type:complete len:773 (+) Transcript_42542:218-2536(+)